jgi:aryl-phospho-beta-D-glucosidase BglC (GH1 family)
MWNKERLRGVNLGGWFSQVDCIEEKDPAGFPGIDTHLKTFLGQSDFRDLKNWGFNHVRIPLDYFNLFDDEGNLTHPDRLSQYVKVLEQCGQEGLLVLLDLHKCPGHDFYKGIHEEQSFFTSLEERQAARKVWRQLIEATLHMPHVMYEILNEPVASKSEQWDAVKDEFTAYIREQAPDHTIVVGSNKWNSVSEFNALTPVKDENILYSFHFYNPVLFTHQNVPWHTEDKVLQTTREYPGEYLYDDSCHHRMKDEFGVWDKERLRDALKPVLDFRDRHKAQIACGEFGAWAQVARKSRMAWTEDILSVFQEEGLGFSYWNYKNLDFGVISVGESLHANLPCYQNEQHLDKELLDLLRKY